MKQPRPRPTPKQAAEEALAKYFHDEAGGWPGHSAERDDCFDCGLIAEVLASAGLLAQPEDLPR